MNARRLEAATCLVRRAGSSWRQGKIAGRQMSRRVLKMSGQTDRERAADLMAGGANAFKDYMFFSDEQDRSSSRAVLFLPWEGEKALPVVQSRHM